MTNPVTSLQLSVLRGLYKRGELTPRELMASLRQRAEGFTDKNIWIHLLSEAEQETYLVALEGKSPDDLPLYGIPFAIKDNIDLAGIPSTAACPDYVYVPEQHAFVVGKLIEAGAIPVGKTNLDQFATGLVGTRSPEPWGPCKNAFNDDYISGGSSSGSAVATALGLVSFALGTDTAGSGRVPASFNNLVGLKPTRGVLSASGMIPACRTLDTISIFTLTAEDAATVLDLAAGEDGDAYGRPLIDSIYPGLSDKPGFTVAVPFASQLEFFGDSDAQGLFASAVETLKAAGAEIVEKDFSHFFDAAKLLYQGPWVAERYAALQEFIESKPDSFHPVIREIIQPADKLTAVDAFKSEYQMQAYRKQTDAFFAEVDFALTPTAGTIYPMAEVLANPIQLNSNLGYYTNFMNLLDLAALAVPAGFNAKGLPWGVTVYGPAGCDRALLKLAQHYLKLIDGPLGATGIARSEDAPLPSGSADWIPVTVCGAHLSGFPLNHQLTSRGAKLIASTTSAPNYKFYALAGGPPYRPGMVGVEEGGAAIEVEVWAVPAAEFGSFVAGIPAPLGIGKVELADGSWCPGFICEPCGIEGATDITELGSWRNYKPQ
jgi:allophanate hydrolase